MNTSRTEGRWAVKAGRWLIALATALLAACSGGGSTTNNYLSDMKSFVQFSIVSPAANGVIDEQNKAIAITVPYGTNVSALTAYFTTTGKGVSVGAVTQVSGSTANDFTSPVKYVVTAEDGTTVTYTVTVAVAANSAKAITAFSFASPAVTGVINESAKSIDVTVPYGTNVTALVASFTTTGQGVTVNGVAQTSGTTANNFSNAALYQVTAADGSSVDYTVSVTVAPSSAKSIGYFAFPAIGATGVINESAKTIFVAVPSGTNPNGLVAAFSTTGVGVTVAGVAQVSDSTPNNFTNPLTYTVTAADSSTASYTVTVATPGTNWTAQTSGTTNNLNAVVWSGTQFVAVGDAGTILTSPDGVTWTARTSGTGSGIYSVTWSGSQFAATSNGSVLTSPDGVTWTTHSVSLPTWCWSSGGLASITWSGTQYVAVGDSELIVTSPDATTWTIRSCQGSGSFIYWPYYGVTWSGKQFALVGYVYFATSPDGITWTNSTVPNQTLTSPFLKGVAWSGTQFVAVGGVTSGGAGAVYTSPDGITLTQQTVSSNQLNAVTWTGTQFAAVGNWSGTAGTYSTIITSPNGINWTSQNSGTTNALNGVAWSGTQFAAVGAAGTILTSP